MAVEMAFVLPLLMALIFGLIQFGMVLSQAASLASAARSGARIGTVNLISKADCQDVVEATRDQAVGIGMQAARVAVRVERGGMAAEPRSSSAVLVCEAPSGRAAASPGGAAFPCQSTVTSAQKLMVTARYDVRISFAFVPAITFPRATTAVYRCEYQ